MGRKSRSKQRNRSPLALVAPADIDEAPFTGDRGLEALIEEIANGAHDEHLRLLAELIKRSMYGRARYCQLAEKQHLWHPDGMKTNTSAPNDTGFRFPVLATWHIGSNRGLLPATSSTNNTRRIVSFETPESSATLRRD